MSDILGQIAGPIGGVAGSLIGQFGQRRREDRAMSNQRQLMNLQNRNQESLNVNAYNRSLDYKRQLAMMKEAGLNPSLIYGKSGGGSTVGQSSAGSASGGQAPAPQRMLMDMQSGSHMGVNAAKVASEIAVNIV